jgi:monofunctional biosynthetic peptidoglycan transglycosylase
MQAARLAVMLPAPKRFEKRPGSAYLLARRPPSWPAWAAVDLP